MESKDFESCRSVTVALGYVTIDTTKYSNNKTAILRKFRAIGSGLVTYCKADTFSTIDYHGLQITLFEDDGPPNIFLYPNKNFDLAGICIAPRHWTQFYLTKRIESGHPVFPINSILTLNLSNQVWIYGYPDHIENNFQNNFSYCISTFKPGYVTWVPYSGMKNQDLNHITLVESNATHRNSGGPVFSTISDKIIPVEILVQGYEEPVNLYLQNNPNPIKDNSGALFFSMIRSGVSIIEKAENVISLIQFMNIELGKRYKKLGYL